MDSDDEVRALVLRGAGDRAFVAGTDIKQFGSSSPARTASSTRQRMERVIGRLETVRKPVVAVIDGYAIGGGLSIAAVSDLRICTPEAKFGMPIARTLGNCLSIENYARLVRLCSGLRAPKL